MLTVECKYSHMWAKSTFAGVGGGVKVFIRILMTDGMT